MSDVVNLITFERSLSDISTWYPIFPALKIIVSHSSAEISITVLKSFFIPIGEQPPLFIYILNHFIIDSNFPDTTFIKSVGFILIW